jgi:hypothetical protein
LDGLPSDQGGKPAEVLRKKPAEVASIANEFCDDILYFGADKATLEILNDKLAARGIMNVVLGGKRIGAPVNVGVGRVHYGMTRWIGTTGSDPAESYQNIPSPARSARTTASSSSAPAVRWARCTSFAPFARDQDSRCRHRRG